MLRVTTEVIGAGFAVIAGGVIGIAHLIAARDPERNALTRLIRDHYEHTWPLLGHPPTRRAMVTVGVVALMVAFAALGSLIYDLTR